MKKQSKNAVISVILIIIVAVFLAVFNYYKVKNTTNTETKVSEVFEQVGCWERDGSRIYTIFTPDTNWAEMERYAESKPHSNGKITFVFFFINRERTPDVSNYSGMGSDVIDRIYDNGDTTYWIARHDRLHTGKSDFWKYPAR